MKYLYIISQDDKNRFKIGITNNFNRRKKELTRDWGEFHTSFLLRDNINEVDTLEKILNEEFKGYSREFKFKNQGYSEFFDLCILNDVIEYVSSISTDDLVFNKKNKSSVNFDNEMIKMFYKNKLKKTILFNSEIKGKSINEIEWILSNEQEIGEDDQIILNELCHTYKELYAFNLDENLISLMMIDIINDEYLMNCESETSDSEYNPLLSRISSQLYEKDLKKEMVLSEKRIIRSKLKIGKAYHSIDRENILKAVNKDLKKYKLDHIYFFNDFDKNVTKNIFLDVGKFNFITRRKKEVMFLEDFDLYEYKFR